MAAIYIVNPGSPEQEPRVCFVLRVPFDSVQYITSPLIADSYFARRVTDNITEV